MFSQNERQFLFHWTLANIIGWSAGFAASALLFAIGFVLTTVSTNWLWVICLPGIGLGLGLIVGISQERVLELSDDDRMAWRGASAVGGVSGVIVASGVALLLSFDALVARLVAGVILAAVLGTAQSIALVGVNWVALRRWAVIYAFAGGLCAWISLAGVNIWLPISCLLGTGMFGIVTGAAMIRVQQTNP